MTVAIMATNSGSKNKSATKKGKIFKEVCKHRKHGSGISKPERVHDESHRKQKED
jgi:hypothetical protein